MSESRGPIPGWVVPVVVFVVAVALGWYIGIRAGGDGEDTTAEHQTGGEVHRDVAGRVVRLAPEASSFTVDHEEIEGFMRAMVMDLQVVEPAELEGLEPGDEILFDLARIGETYKAVRIRRVGDDGNTAPAPPEAAVESPADPLGPGDLVPDLVLINSDGESFALRDLEPRHKLITFFYARCPIETFCPAQAERLSELQQHIAESGSNLHLVSLTLDAEHDTQEVLAGYAASFDVDPRHWTLAGGEDPEAIRAFAHRAGAQVYAHPDSYEIDHALVALRVDGDRIVDRVYGLDAIERLARAIE